MGTVRFSTVMRAMVLLTVLSLAFGCAPKVTVTVTVSPDGAGAVARDPDQAKYKKGDEVTLTASPDAGFDFVEWTGDLSGSENPAVITVNKNMRITAAFTASESPEGEQPEGEGEPAEGEGETAEGEPSEGEQEGESIEGEGEPYANFDATPTAGFWPLTVTFTDHSEPGSSEITGWIWDFGDGNKSVAQNPTYIYKQPGVYSVSLVVLSDSGEDIYIASDFITVEDAPDTDKDDLPDWLEAELGTDPEKWDTSGDGMSDGSIYYSGGNPLQTYGSLAPEVVVLESHPELKLLEVGEDYLIFEAPTEKAESDLLAPGKIIANNTIPESKENFITEGLEWLFWRSVLQVIPGGTTYMLMTDSNIGIQHIWKNYNKPPFNETITLDTRNKDELNRYLNGYQIYPWQDEKELGVTVTTKDCYFEFIANLYINLRIVDGEVQEFVTRLSGDAEIKVGAKVEATGAYNRVIDEIALVQVPFPIPSTPLLIILSANIDLDLALDGRITVEPTFIATGEVIVGTEWKDGGLKPLDESTIGISADPPTLNPELYASADAMVKLIPKMDITLYSRLGAYAQLEPYLKFSASYPCTPATAPSLTMGADARVTMYAHLFVWGIDYDLMEIPALQETTIWEGGCDLFGEPNEGEGEVAPAGMVSVPATTFAMGDPWSEGDEDELPLHTVTLSPYEIGIYEVTNQEYADILNWAKNRDYLDLAPYNTVDAYGVQILDIDSEYCQISRTDSGFVVETRDGYSMADHPVVCVTWYGAAVYCNWLSESQGLTPCYNTSTWECDFAQNGYHLPTEAQWERAAAWNAESRYHYRYGNGSDIIDCSNANFDYCNPLGLSGTPYTSPVGYYSGVTSPVGCYDMSGNVWEWCQDWYGTYPSGSVTDPTGPVSGSYRVGRGGGWGSGAGYCRSADRSRNIPDIRRNSLGVRLAAGPAVR